MQFVIDASVALKWFLREEDTQENTRNALQLLQFSTRQTSLKAPFLQPVHFVAEVAAGLARLKSPAEAQTDVADLLELDFQIADSSPIYLEAMRLAQTCTHHLFDTLYHAVALKTPDTVFVTADERYFRKASSQGAIVRLADLDLAMTKS